MRWTKATVSARFDLAIVLMLTELYMMCHSVPKHQIPRGIREESSRHQLFQGRRVIHSNATYSALSDRDSTSLFFTNHHAQFLHYVSFPIKFNKI